LSNFQAIAILPPHGIDQVRYSTSCPGLIVEAEPAPANLARHVKQCPSRVFDFFPQLSAGGFHDG
jgi:hypothetical protein